MMDVVVAKRKPPGDKWEFDGDIIDNLTDTLNKIFLKRNVSTFVVKAREGEICIDDGVPIIEPTKPLDLYGEN